MKQDDIQTVKINNHTFVTQISAILNKKSHKSVTFTVQGYSMRPFLEHDRDKVELTLPQKPQIGQVVLAEVMPRTYALHRIIKIEGDTITMRGDGNLLSQTETFTADKIIATAVSFTRKGKRVSVQSKKWKLYSLLWESLKPMRRILLGLHRRVIKITKI